MQPDLLPFTGKSPKIFFVYYIIFDTNCNTGNLSVAFSWLLRIMKVLCRLYRPEGVLNMNSLQNLHQHTVFCDGKDTPEEVVLTAIEKGFCGIGFSGHC